MHAERKDNHPKQAIKVSTGCLLMAVMPKIFKIEARNIDSAASVKYTNKELMISSSP